MSSYFSSGSRDEPWFRLGRLDVNSTMLVVLLGIVGLLASVVAPSLPYYLGMLPSQVFAGQVWRLFTWPLIPGSNLLWTVLTLVMLWYFGTDLERDVGRGKMMRLYVGIWLSLTIAALFVGLLVPDSVMLAGLSQVQFAVLLLFIAEHPRRPFFFGIPAWALGAVLVAVEVLQLLMYRLWGSLFAFVLGLIGVAVAARAAGLLSDHAWIPGRKQSTTRRKPARPTRHQRAAADVEERIDQLLDKIARQGIHSLTKSERAELEKLRQKRRRS